MFKLRKIFGAIVCFLFAFAWTSCSGFNGVMYKRLGAMENYREYEVVIEQIYVVDLDSGKVEKYDKSLHDGEYLSETTVYFGISEIEGFYGGEKYLSNGEKTESLVWLEVISDNSKLLVNSGFYDCFSVGNTVEVRASNWTYGDKDFYYVIGVAYEETQYLSGEAGLQNIVAMMDGNRSLF